MIFVQYSIAMISVLGFLLELISQEVFTLILLEMLFNEYEQSRSTEATFPLLFQIVSNIVGR